MAFDVYPSPQTTPLDIASGGAGVTTAITTERHSGGSPDEMFIRVVGFGSAVPPTIRLAASGGAPVTVPMGATAAIFDAGSNYVAAALMETMPNNVYRVTIVLSKLGSTWAMTIVNNDAAPRKFTFVVADSDAAAQQPWIETDTSFAFDALVTETGAKAVTVFNYGTGDLTGLAGALSGLDAAAFAVAVPPTPISANSSANVQVSLTAGPTPATLAATLNFTSNDTTAGTVAGHNGRVALSAKVGQLEIAFMLDGSGSMAYDPDGKTTFIGFDNGSTRWGKLKAAAGLSLNVLKNFAAGKGTFAVGMYPNITPFPPDPTGPYAGPFPVPSPTAGDFQAVQPISVSAVNDAIGSIEQHFPRVNGAATPMGAGIAHAIGSTAAAPWGYFSSGPDIGLNRRWLILMTDGNDNSDPPYPSDFFGNGTADQGFLPKQVRVMALGYGNDDAVGAIAPVNKTLLTDTAKNAYLGSAANYHLAQADATPDLTSKFVKSLLFAGLTLDTIADPAATLTASQPTLIRQVIVGPYDDKVAFIAAWNGGTSDRITVEVTTPLCEVLTQSTGDGVTIDFGDRYRMVTVDRTFLDNAYAGKPRHGVWTLKLTLNPPDIILLRQRADLGARPQDDEGEDSENVNYQIIADSRLNLRCTVDRTGYAAGDAIGVTAALTLDGMPVTGAAVRMTQTLPGSGALNWLARTPLSAEAYERVARQLEGNPDLDSLGIKRFGLAQAGLSFDPFDSRSLLTLSDPDATGRYAARTAPVGVPGTASFVVTAAGMLPDGSLFQREQAITLEVLVRPDPVATVSQLQYLDSHSAIFTVWPRDPFGNVVLIDPAIDPSLQFTIQGGTFSGPTIDNHDGSYGRPFAWTGDTPPTVGVTVGGTTVVEPTPVQPIDKLYYVDKVHQYQAGAEGAPGANQHIDPTACLGDFTKRGTDPGFVSLGAGGSLVVGFSHHYAQGSVTVFVHPDQQLRPYSVEALHGDAPFHWFELGCSAGGTQTFDLHHLHELPTACALRIRDLSGRTLDADGSPSATPGVSILAVGTARLERGDGDLDDLILNWLRKHAHRLIGR